MNITNEQLRNIIQEELEAILSEMERGGYSDKLHGTMEEMHQQLADRHGTSLQEIDKELKKGTARETKEHGKKKAHEIAMEHVYEDAKYYTKMEKAGIDEGSEKEPCKPSKGKRFAKRVNGKCRSYGQKGQAKGGGDRIRPGTKKGDAYCARSAKIKKCKNPPCANDLSRKKWKCRGSKSMK